MHQSQSKKYLAICNDDLCHREVGLNGTYIDNTKAVIELKLKKWHMNFEKCAHGGILSFLLDTVMGFCVYPHLIPPERILAIEIKVNYIKPATLGMKKIISEGRLISRTRRLAISEGEIFSPDGAILCKGLGTYAILKK